MFRVTVRGPREQEASFFTVVVWRDQAEHGAESWELVADELRPSLGWATATTTRTARNQHQ